MLYIRPVARPRTHDIDSLLDAAERILAEDGSAALTIRALAQATGAPSGSLYHAFGSRSDLLGQMWLRAAQRFLDEQEKAIERELLEPGNFEQAVAATVAVASVPAVIESRAPDTATVLLRYRRDDILGQDLSPALRTRLEELDGRLLAILNRLAEALWSRHDRASVETVAICVVDLPTAILIRRRERVIDPLTVLEAAVRGVIASHG